MAFIRTQKLVRNRNGAVSGGSAAVIDTLYVQGGKYHSKQEVRERLGKIVQLDDDGRRGVFLSPTRGLVCYDADADAFSAVERGDERIEGLDIFKEGNVHTVFGDAYLLLKFLEKTSLLAVLKAVFPKKQEFERVMAHILHGILRDGSKITCDNFIAKSFATYLLGDIPIASLKSDTAYFAMMGEDGTRMSFFTSFIKAMRRKEASFGKGCYVDSTPLPNSITDNPFNALCRHGVSGASVQMRLVLVIDEASGLPVWYDIIPGNVLDINTIMTVVEDVSASLDIQIDSLVLDAGYVSKELVGAFHIGTEKTIVARMPARRGFPYKELYWDVKSLLGKGKYSFVRNQHTYFGKRKEIYLFGHKEYAYVYVDQQNALQRFQEYLINHEDDYVALKDRDKDWARVKNGFFVLVSNIDTTPPDLLSDYFARVEIETVFKTSKEYLGLLPLSKWTDLTVRGKILHDIIDTVILLQLRKEIISSGISISELVGRTQSLMCFRDSNGAVTVETPNKLTKQYYGQLGIDIPSHLKIASFKNQVFRL